MHLGVIQALSLFELFTLVQGVAIGSDVQIAGVEPTSAGQIGVNPITDFGPATQYIGDPGPYSDILIVQNGNTQWKGANTYAFTEVPVTRTVGGQATTEVAPVQISVSKAESSGNGVSPGDASVVIVPALKTELGTFAVDVVEACKLVMKVKRDSDTTLASQAFTQCITQKSVEATSQGGRLNSIFEVVDLEAGLPNVPSAAAAEIDVWAAALQIAKNQVRRKAAWMLTIILSAYSVDKLIHHVYKVPANPTGIIDDLNPTPTEECKSGAPTGANAPVCSDDDCQGLPRDKKCLVGDWKGCKCSGTAIYYGNPNLIDLGWLKLQQKVLDEIMNAPEDGVECGLVSGKDFNGNPYYDPEAYCVCGNVNEPHDSMYPTISANTNVCGYTSLPASQITVRNISTSPRESVVTSCRDFKETIDNEEKTSCTCNNNFRYQYLTPYTKDTETMTWSGCDRYIETAVAPGTPTAPNTATPTPSTIDINLGKATCLPKPEERGANKAEWYMSNNTAIEAIKQHCVKWDAILWPVGPGDENKKSYSDRIEINNSVPPVGGEQTTVYLSVRHVGGGDKCPVLDIGGKDKAPLCEDVYGTIIRACDPDQAQVQGGRFQRDCLQWQIGAYCDVGKDAECMFK